MDFTIASLLNDDYDVKVAAAGAPVEGNGIRWVFEGISGRGGGIGVIAGLAEFL